MRRLAFALTVVVLLGSVLFAQLKVDVSLVNVVATVTDDKKAILLITDGVDTASFASLDEAQLSVRESELLVYCIGIAPANTGTMTERNPTPPNNGGTYPGGGRRGGGGGYPGGGYPGGGV